MSVTLLPNLSAPAAGKPDDRAERYVRRLDAQLATLSDDLHRRWFCDREYVKWERLYNDWLSDPSIAPGAHAADFMLTLAFISVRQIKYRNGLLRAAPTSVPKANESENEEYRNQMNTITAELNAAYEAGYRAYQEADDVRTRCPYSWESSSGMRWRKGWSDARREREAETSN
jgi:hypothetical protein